MALHSGERKRHFPEEMAVARDAIARVPEENGDWRRDLVEHSQDLLCIHDLEGRLLSVNPVPARLLGYSVKELLQKRLRDIIDPQFQAEHNEYLREIKREGESHGLMAAVARSGEKRIWEYHNTLRTEGVVTPIVRGIAHDVTERVLAEKALRAINEKLLQAAAQREQSLRDLTLFRTLLDQSTDAIEVTDPETLHFLDVNETACLELGYSREELLSMSVYDTDPNVNEGLRERVEQKLRQSGFAIIESVHRRKDGTTFPVEVTIRRVRLDREYNVVVSRDITERKQTEERLREFERVVENLEDMIVVIDRNYRYVLANRAFLRYRGMTREQLAGSLLAEVLNPGVFGAVVQEKVDQCFRGEIVSFELTYRYPEMGERNLSITYLPVEGPTGIDRAACILRDVTEQKRTEQALRQSEERFRVALKHSPITVFSQDRDLRYTWMYNPQVQGAEPGPVGKTPCELYGPDEGERMSEVRRRVLKTGAAVRHEVQITDRGTKHYFDTTIEPVLDSTGAVIGITGASAEITQLREVTEALRELRKS